MLMAGNKVCERFFLSTTPTPNITECRASVLYGTDAHPDEEPLGNYAHASSNRVDTLPTPSFLPTFAPRPTALRWKTPYIQYENYKKQLKIVERILASTSFSMASPSSSSHQNSKRASPRRAETRGLTKAQHRKQKPFVTCCRLFLAVGEGWLARLEAIQGSIRRVLTKIYLVLPRYHSENSCTCDECETANNIYNGRDRSSSQLLLWTANKILSNKSQK